MLKLSTPVLLWSLLILSLLSILASMTLGSAGISLSELATCAFSRCHSPITETILWQIRLPRILVGFVAGAGLACAGAILQNTTRNALADPYIFGIVSGAGLGATLAQIVFNDSLSLSLPVAAFIGAIASITLVIIIAKLVNGIEQVLLAGVAVSFMFAAITQFILYVSEPFATTRILFWLMGSLSNVTLNNFWIISGVILISILIILSLNRHIDALMLGDDTAKSLGVNPIKLRMLMFALCAAITATIVAYCGGIGFVGLMVPHIVRQLVGASLVPLILGCTFVGGIFLIWVDVIARSSIETLEIPIGIITSALGSMFFLLMLARKTNK